MLDQQSRLSIQTHDYPEVNQENLSLIAYRSIARTRPTEAALQELLRNAQRRNRAEGLTGVLVYAAGAYFQWLEGPTASLQRVWASILRDPRHHTVRVLRDEPVSTRAFEGWDLQIAQAGNISIEATVAAMEASNATLQRVIGNTRPITDMSWDDVFAHLIIPRLLEVHGHDFPAVRPFVSTASLWHAHPDSGAQLAAALIAPKAATSSDFVDALLDRGASFNALYQEVFEPAQLQLGKLWDQELCDDWYLTVGLARLQMEIRRVNAAIPADYLHKPTHRVLLSAQPNEPHCVGLVMSSEVFDRRGWHVMSHFPEDDQGLMDLVHEQWFDVLKLSQSGSLRRDGRLSSIRTTIDAARGASLNPSLVVMVDGRTFSERPQVYRAVNAHAVCVSAIEAATLAERLLDVSPTVTPVCERSVS